MEEDIEMQDNSVNNFNSEDSQDSMQQDNNANINQYIHYNLNEYEDEYIYTKLVNLKLLENNYRCPKCYNYMKLTKDNSFIDKKVWRCTSSNPKHDVKINVRINSIYEGLQVKLFILYFLIFECFLLHKSIKKSYLDLKDLCSQLGQQASSYNTINKIFQQLREKMRLVIHNKWKKNLLGLEPSEKGVPRIEIDESKIIGNNDNTIWMFGMIDRYDKGARVLSVYKKINL